MLLFAADPLPVGKSTIEVNFGEVPLTLFAYKSKDYSDGPLIMVFHGVLRNAEEYRDDSVEMGDRFKALIIAPRFDEPNFPKPKYQFGGILDDGKVTPREQWTGEYVNRITREIRLREGRPQMPLYLIGHSGGAQFLIRLAAFVKTDAVRTVAANPGTHLFPLKSFPFPFGIGELPEELQSDDLLRAYLAQPLTIYLGTEDTERDEHLDKTPPAEAQGAFRYERGLNAFAAAKKLAEERHWKFGWKIVIAQGIEHDHTKMFNHPQCAVALELKDRAK
jgi:pimeloyl-ACP methyl ester carboxylesterase